MKFELSRAALIALALEILVIAAFAVALEHPPEKEKPKQPVVMLTFPALPEPPKPQAPPKPEKPVSKREPVHHEQPKQEPVQQPKIEETAPSPAAIATPTPDPPKQETPVPEPSVNATFRDAVREAVQAAVRYPYAARVAHISGKTQVSFTYRDRNVFHPEVAVSSGYAMLDNAAKQAVETAAYPSPPPELAGRNLQFLVWVRFTHTSMQ
ncbi:MAG: energy transducer TonB [Burkholderiales bacterium]